MFMLDEILMHLAQMEYKQSKQIWDISQEDNPLRESPAAAVQHVRQFMMIKELLTMTGLGIS